MAWNLPQTREVTVKVLLLFLLVAMGLTLSGASAKGQDEEFHQLFQEFLKGHLEFSPSTATWLGFHDYDSRLESFSKEQIHGEVARLKSFLERLKLIDPARLSFETSLDYSVLQSQILAALLELEEVRSWEKNPDFYNWIASGSVHSLTIRNFAPVEKRLQAILAREREIPRLFREARENIKNPPRIYVEVAIEQSRGGMEFFEEVVPSVAQQISDRDLQKAVLEESKKVADAYREFIAFLNRLLPEARGEYALGKELFLKKLRFDEMVETPPEQIVEKALEEQKKTQEEMKRLASRISPGLTVARVVEELSKEHPAVDDLIPFYRRSVHEAREFVLEHGILDIPPGEDLRIEETPLFSRSLSFASMDTPGPFEQSNEAYFYVTPADRSSSSKEQEEYLRAHSVPSVYATIVHEAYPGHYLQGLYQRLSSSKVRKIFWTGTFGEGWAHYCEQMMLEEGLRSSDLKMKLFQLHEALLRINRAIVGTRMHISGMTVDEAVRYLEREGFMEKINAEREVRRYTQDPLVLMYFWGKQQILALREEMKQQKGKSFSLKEFHRALLSEGSPPLSIIRTALLRSKISKIPPVGLTKEGPKVPLEAGPKVPPKAGQGQERATPQAKEGAAP